jgi:hypothetical protein
MAIHRRHVVAVLLLVQLLVLWSVVGGLFLREVKSETQFLDLEGFVCAQNCEQRCGGESGCYYKGTVDLCFVYNATPWRVTAHPQDACGDDCCAALVRDQTPIWILLNDDNPLDVANFYLGSAYISGPYYSGGIALLVLAALLGCGLLLALYGTIRVECCD